LPFDQPHHGVNGVSGLLQVDTDIPAGNGLIESIDGDTITLRPDLRDSDREWFYWHIRVRGCKGRRITLHLNQDCCFTVRGPAVSFNRGRDWQWACEHKPFTRYATCDCGPHDEGWFSMGMPYGEPALRRFLDDLAGHPEVRRQVLCRSRKGRTVPLLEIGPADGSETRQVAVTARHHSCEMMASYVLEGLVAALLAQPGLCHQTRFFIVPMMDLDGCLDGDQGKGRRPHDHNRDYSASPIYPETRAWNDLLRRRADHRLQVALDLHCPFIFGEDWNQHLYLVGNPHPRMWERQQAFARQLEAVHQGPLPYRAGGNLPFGKAWNTRDNFGGGTSCAQWIGEQFAEQVMATTLEIPYATVDGIPVTQNSARAFGRDLAAAIAAWQPRALPE
jgi:hypothetical protein